jgi:hypothetical protein
VLVGADPCHRICSGYDGCGSTGPSIHGRQTGTCILYLSPPVAVLGNRSDLSLPEAFGFAIATRLGGLCSSPFPTGEVDKLPGF